MIIFEQFYLGCLAHASYLIGSEGTAAVVDPQRDVGIYLETAAKHGLEIRYVIETHLHADFVSGHNELAARTGAEICLGARADPQFRCRLVGDGDELSFGRAVLRFLATPGHTIESVCVLVTDLDRSAEPFAVLTGDTLFIGDVGRPDLSPDHSPRDLAGMLYDSLQNKLLILSDDVEVYPAHGAGSLCGRNMSSDRKSTIGIQRTSNYALRSSGRHAFIDMMTADLPQRPEYFLRDVDLNRRGAPPLAALPPLQSLTAHELLELQNSGAVLLDTRPASDFAAAHVPGSIQIGLAGQYASWAGALIPFHSRIAIIAESDASAAESRIRLARVGLEGVAGYLAEGLAGWSGAGFATEQTMQISADDLHRRITEDPDIQVIDVRKRTEWQDGYVPGAALKPLNEFTNLLGDLDRDRPVAAYCKGGYRSSIATSLLHRAQFRQVVNMTGGFDAWKTCQLPVAVPRADG